MNAYLYHTGTGDTVLTLKNVTAWDDSHAYTGDGGVYGPFAEGLELTLDPTAQETRLADWRRDHPSDTARLNDLEALTAFLNTDVYRSCTAIRCTCQHSTAGNFTSDKYALSEKSSFILIQENVYGEDRQILVSSKHYLPVELFRLELEAGRKI